MHICELVGTLEPFGLDLQYRELVNQLSGGDFDLHRFLQPLIPRRISSPLPGSSELAKFIKGLWKAIAWMHAAAGRRGPKKLGRLDRHRRNLPVKWR